MQVMRTSLALSLLLCLCVCTGVAAQQASGIESMKLLTPEIGWASSGSSLFWTTDNGQHWKDIAPRTKEREEIASVFFLDNFAGWVLLVDEAQADKPKFDVAATSDGGRNWS